MVGGGCSDPGACFVPLSHSISVNGKVITCDGGCQVVVDTGTALLIGPKDPILNILKINAEDTNTSEHIIDYNTINTLPDIVFTINGSQYPVPARAYIQEVRVWGTHHPRSSHPVLAQC
uniref:Peptidase A1 domain-containing protein n=1 Tax=Rhinolophus ferrumequinum TaxID=59479 RepID=A0A671DNA9_RHIFE